MPKKLERCVKKVRKGGKGKSAAYGICVKSTGQKPYKKHMRRSKSHAKQRTGGR